jgi:hypothetical protein
MGHRRTHLYNIPYAYVHEGKLAFPIYGFGSPASFDRLFVHPPTHYAEVSLLMKAGIPVTTRKPSPLCFSRCFALRW